MTPADTTRRESVQAAQRQVPRGLHVPISMQRLWQELLERVGEPASPLKLHRQIVSLLQKPDPVILDIGHMTELILL
ncbi:hypothetical protein [Aminobacter anthyllidis]|uniref:hypothetical protein n=1 Tax=Aminobacter anthyllidis TaxID=1035067 RepID=UPI0023DEB33F|nr:hypothetical protein [Aminobacter anthyllidis]